MPDMVEDTPLRRVLVVHDKHGDDYWSVDTDEELAEACLAILKERLEAGWYGDPTADQSEYAVKARRERDELLALTDEQINALPDAIAASVQNAVTRARDTAFRQERERDWYLAVAAAVEQHNTGMIRHRRTGEPLRPFAWDLLNSRAGEYENVELVTLRRV